MKEIIGSCSSVESFTLSPDAENKVQFVAYILWNMSPCKLTYRYKRFEWAVCLPSSEQCKKSGQPRGWNYIYFFTQNIHTQHTKQAKIGYMFRPIKHHHSLIMNSKNTLDTPPLHITINYRCIQDAIMCICIHVWIISVYFNSRNILPKSGTFRPGQPVYDEVWIYTN
jgi:hypothetical protein